MCPECGQPLVAFELRGVEIDHCVDCGGTWLDAGELETITESAGVPSGELSRALSPPNHKICSHMSQRPIWIVEPPTS